MTDARYPERWLNDRRLLRISDAAYRLFVTALAWSVSNRTDGLLHDDELCLLPRVDTGCAEELKKANLWERDRDRWVVIDYASTQTTAAQLAGLEHKRVLDRERQARHRARVRAASESAAPSSSGDVTRDITRDTPRDEPSDVTRDVTCHATRDTKARPGQDRTGATKPEKNARARGTRLPEGFTVTEDMVAWARENTPDVNGRTETAAFVDYWRSKAGPTAVKVDWTATWRNWMRRAQDNPPPRTNGHHRPAARPTADDKIAAWQAMKTPALPALPAAAGGDPC